MDADSKTRISKYLSYLLRHHPEAAGLKLDEHGWAVITELIAAVRKKYPMNESLLEEIVQTDEKQRYAFSEDHQRIRANQGHSIPVDVELTEAVPPEFLYHGTAEKSVEKILEEGLKPMGRLYVHLSKDPSTAVKVGQRHGKPAVFLVRSEDMYRDGFRFFLSSNQVWLIPQVPARYLVRFL